MIQVIILDMIHVSIYSSEWPVYTHTHTTHKDGHIIIGIMFIFILIYIIIQLSVCQIQLQQRPRKLDVDVWHDVIKGGIDSKFDIWVLRRSFEER